MEQLAGDVSACTLVYSVFTAPLVIEVGTKGVKNSRQRQLEGDRISAPVVSCPKMLLLRLQKNWFDLN